MTSPSQAVSDTSTTTATACCMLMLSLFTFGHFTSFHTGIIKQHPQDTLSAVLLGSWCGAIPAGAVEAGQASQVKCAVNLPTSPSPTSHAIGWESAGCAVLSGFWPLVLGCAVWRRPCLVAPPPQATKTQDSAPTSSSSVAVGNHDWQSTVNYHGHQTQQQRL